ncbi:MAG: phosphoesterase, partial [Firmicutes bacterium]|nr:phosphoesterase [Bacillota bacterium]
MNLARAMVAKGYAASVREAFDRFLRPGKPAYIPRKHIETVRGVEMLRSFGAVVCLAHPGRLAMDRFSLVQRLPGWIEAGLNGLEAYHASHAEADALWFDRTARSRGLLVTGGSDCHGPSPGGSRIGDHLDRWRTVREDVRDLIGQIEQGTAKIQ